MSLFRGLRATAALLTLSCAGCANRELPKAADADFASRAEPHAAATYTPTASVGCGLTGKPTGDLRLTAKDGKGVVRDYEVLVPTSYNSSVPLALLFAYHGAGGSASDAKGYGFQDAPGAAAAALFVFPQGGVFQGSGVGWDDTCSGYDMAFFDNMLASLAANYCIDTKRVFASGFSWGGDQVTALACCRGDRIRGIAAASCTDEFNNAASYQSYRNLPCPVRNSAAIRFTHDSSGGDSGYPSPLFATTSSLFRSFNQCSDNATVLPPGPCRTFSGCNNPFLDCPYVGLGHRPPPTWANDSWAFFSTLSEAASAPSPVPSLRRPSVVIFGLFLLGVTLLALGRPKQHRPAS